MKEWLDDLEMNQLIMSNAELTSSNSESEIVQNPMNNGSYTSYAFEEVERPKRKSKGILNIFKNMLINFI